MVFIDISVAKNTASARCRYLGKREKSKSSAEKFPVVWENRYFLSVSGRYKNRRRIADDEISLLNGGSNFPRRSGAPCRGRTSETRYIGELLANRKKVIPDKTAFRRTPARFLGECAPNDQDYDELRASRSHLEIQERTSINVALVLRCCALASDLIKSFGFRLRDTCACTHAQNVGKGRARVTAAAALGGREEWWRLKERGKGGREEEVEGERVREGVLT